jgi:Spy/CpxP family protein refolding chaperone
VDFLAGYLSLTDDQKVAAKAIFDAADAAAQTVSGQLASAHDALRAAIKSGAPDTDLDTLSLPIGTLEGQLTAIQAKAQSKFYALLTDEQKAKYDARGGGMGGPRGMQGRGPRGQ